MSRSSGDARCGGAARRTVSRGTGLQGWPTTGSPCPVSFTHGRTNASPSDTQGGSRMRESRTYGSVRGAPSNGRPYRDRVKPCEAALAVVRDLLRKKALVEGDEETV